MWAVLMPENWGRINKPVVEITDVRRHWERLGRHGGLALVI